MATKAVNGRAVRGRVSRFRQVSEIAPARNGHCRRGSVVAPLAHRTDLDARRLHRGSSRQRLAQRAPERMQHFIFNLAEGDRERANSFLHAKRWVVSREERHRDALAPGDLALIFVARTHEFVGRAEIKTTFLDPIPCDPANSGIAVSGVLLGHVENWARGVPLDAAVKAIDPKRSNPYVQANAAGFRTGVVQITVKEFDIVVALRDTSPDTGQ